MSQRKNNEGYNILCIQKSDERWEIKQKILQNMNLLLFDKKEINLLKISRFVVSGYKWKALATLYHKTHFKDAALLP